MDPVAVFKTNGTELACAADIPMKTPLFDRGFHLGIF